MFWVIINLWRSVKLRMVLLSIIDTNIYRWPPHMTVMNIKFGCGKWDIGDNNTKLTCKLREAIVKHNWMAIGYRIFKKPLMFLIVHQFPNSEPNRFQNIYHILFISQTAL